MVRSAPSPSGGSAPSGIGGELGDEVPANARLLAQSIPSPRARRLLRPRWRDHRLVLGVVLVLASVVLGARILATADHSRSWVAVKSDLPTGHVLSPADLTAASGRLVPAAAGHYYDAQAAASLVGHHLARPVGAGEMLARSAVLAGRRPPTRVVPVVVKAGRLPDLDRGDLVDVYVLARAGQGSALAGREVQVAAAAEFLDRQDLASGGGVAVQLRVPVGSAPSLVAASQSERVDVVRVDPGSSGELGDAGETSVPAYGS